MAKEYIDREAAKRELLSWAVCMNHPEYLLRDDALHIIDSIPAADVTPVRHGQWIDGHCSECGEEATFTPRTEPVYDYDWEENLYYSHDEIHNEYNETNYCPNCGARMDGAE